ncbi:MAG: ATP-binding protein [Candidatus Omnitrophica bacterium]|nr:ATP-binding protein [Candidatus Omnitrophota bacterium]MDD5671426.1 ATP-binding protein [Candidatus Omnitrophota bacterium]
MLIWGAKLQEKKSKFFRFRMSLRYKLTVPIVIFGTLMFSLLFNTTFRVVRTLVLERIEGRLKAVTDVFSEALKVPLLLENYEDLQKIMEWMASHEDVLEVRLDDPEGKLLASVNPTVKMPDLLNNKDFYGVRRIASDIFIVSAPIRTQNVLIGRVSVLFSQLGFEEELKQIFIEKLLMAFIMIGLLAVLTAVVTWIGILPLINLKNTVKQILSGDLSARAKVQSHDEIGDLADAFNEMVSRLAMSLDRLRSRTEALEESEEKYRLIVENASDIIFTLTPEGELVLLNKGFSGCRREEFLKDGLSLMLALHTEDSSKHFQEALEDVIRRKEPIHNLPMANVLQGSQSKIFYLANLTPVLDHEGEVKLIQGVMRDITELRRIEMMKESLVRDVAHELKTPTAKFEMTLNWFEKELAKKNEKERYGEIMTILKNNVERLMHTITSIMDLSKLESGVDHIAKTELDLNEVLEQLFKDMTILVNARKLGFELHLCKEPLRVMGDRHMLYRLFSNLIQNAMKFTDSGKITLTSRREDGQIIVEVRDTGIGIEKNDLEIIFERFVQKTAASTGIGVGLTICRDIVMLHQGRIWAESAGLGQGAALKVELPPA